MDRIASLLQEIQELHRNQADAADLLPLVQQLQSALFEQSVLLPKTGKRVAVMMPSVPTISMAEEPSAEFTAPEEEEKVVEVLQVDEKAVEQELNEIKEKVAFTQQMQPKPILTTPGLLFEPEDDLQEVPTFIHQPGSQSIKPSPASAVPTADATLNEQLASHQKEVSDQLSSAPIRDLRKAIGINDRFVFINELFRGDESMYERSIKTINNFTNYAEANYWMERELKVKLGWDDTLPATRDFYALLRRRFS